MKVERIKERLVAINLAKELDSIDVIPIESSFVRKDFGTSEKFRILINGSNEFILRIGNNLELLYDKYKLAAAKYPELFPGIFLYESENEKQILLEEFVKGDTLESFIKKNPAEEKRIIQSVLELHANLNKTVTQSDYKNASIEIDSLLNNIIELEFLTPVDSALIREVIRPEILNLLKQRESFNKRITQGDFIDRNIILTPSGKLRIIDLEFLRETHFYSEELFRFFSYSSSISIKEFNNPKPDFLDEIYFLINQLNLVLLAHKNYLHSKGFDLLMYRIFEIIRDKSDNYKHSRIIKFLNGDFWGLSAIINSKNELIHKREYELSAMVNSYTWKIARIISYPIRKVLSMFRR